MSTAELKNDLINHIAGISDNVQLEELLELINFQNDSTVYVTNDQEREAISEAQSQITNGQVLSNAEVQKEISQWLSK